jgi:hypothetical protein
VREGGNRSVSTESKHSCKAGQTAEPSLTEDSVLALSRPQPCKAGQTAEPSLTVGLLLGAVYAPAAVRVSFGRIVK